MTMRRLSLIFVLVAALAGCSSGSSNVASSTKSTSPTAANPTSAPAPATVAATKAPPAADSAGDAAIGFCGAFKELQEATTANDPAALAAAVQEAAAQMRKWAPPDIKDAAGTYAGVIADIGEACRLYTSPSPRDS